MSDGGRDLDAQLAVIRDRFRGRLPGYRDRLQEAQKGFERGANSAEVTAIKRLAHEIAGTAGTLGFAAIGRASIAVETAADSVLAGTSLADSLREPLERLIREIELEI